jgi:hypothetical protein
MSFNFREVRSREEKSCDEVQPRTFFFLLQKVRIIRRSTLSILSQGAGTTNIGILRFRNVVSFLFWLFLYVLVYLIRTRVCSCECEEKMGTGDIVPQSVLQWLPLPKNVLWLSASFNTYCLFCQMSNISTNAGVLRQILELLIFRIFGGKTSHSVDTSKTNRSDFMYVGRWGCKME